VNSDDKNEDLASFDTAIVIDPNNINAWRYRADSFTALGREQEAFDSLEKAFFVLIFFIHFFK